jgi:hypothetical protein
VIYKSEIELELNANSEDKSSLKKQNSVTPKKPFFQDVLINLVIYQAVQRGYHFSVVSMPAIERIYCSDGFLKKFSD